ncbi:MAG: flagellar biosynthetic protein FliR [Chlamydiales bacterium]
MSSSDLSLLLLFFARLMGFFLISPLFSHRNVPLTVRLGLALACTFLVAPPLAIQFELPKLAIMPLIGELSKELFIGYLLGFLFALLVEAAQMAGQIVGTMGGFTLTELFDPMSRSHPLVGKFFALTIFVLFLALDLHHILLNFLFESFRLLPLNAIRRENSLQIAEASARLFTHAISYAFIPILFLSFVLITFAVIVRALPNFPIFWIGFPAQLLIGLLAIVLAITFFSEILQQAFFEFLTFAQRVLFPL